MKPCDACHQSEQSAELQLTAAGQWLCRSCYGIYQSRSAHRTIVAGGGVRRCTCGAHLVPMDDPTQPESEFAFRASVYFCTPCRKKLRMEHPVTLLIIGLLVVVATSMLLRGFSAIAAVSLVTLLGSLAYDLYKRLHYPLVA